MSVEDPPGADELFELDPEEFVTERDALARRLRGEGQKEGAAAVKALRRPTVAAWALNQLARRHGDEVRALVAEGQELAQAQSRALGGDREGFREAAERRREAIRQLSRRADAILASRNAGAQRDDVIASLTAASVDPDAAEALLGGRLSAPIPGATGFEGTLAVPEASPAGSEPGPEPEREKPAKGTREERQKAAAAKKVAEAQRAVDEEQARADEASEVAREAAEAADASDERVRRLEAELDEARRSAGDDARRARETAARATAAAKRAEAAAERARRAAERPG